MTTDTYTIDITDFVDELREGLQDIEERADELRRQAREHNEEEGYVPNDVYDEYEALNESYRNLENNIEKITEGVDDNPSIIEEYGGTEWTVKDVKAGDSLLARDKIQRQSRNGEIPQGALNIELCRRAIVEAPPESPRDDAGNPEPADYYPVVYSWIADEVQNERRGSSEGLSPLEDSLGGA